jgi:superoxide dismutase, Fe-Mn family
MKLQLNIFPKINYWLRRLIAIGATLLIVLMAVSCQSTPTPTAQTPATSPSPTSSPTATASPLPVASVDRELAAYPAQLPPLPYPNGALEKAIDARTMELHHDRHHATYVKNLNAVLQQQSNLQKQSVETLLRDLNSVPESIREQVRNNGGGHLNHTIFWQIMSPTGGGQPTGALAQEINQTFGSFETFRQQFNQAGGDRFGSGWVWLVRNPQGQLQIVSTANQDNPISSGSYPIMGNDVWEHAYYLRYQNRRDEYLNNWWNVVNWQEIDRRAQISQKR